MKTNYPSNPPPGAGSASAKAYPILAAVICFAACLWSENVRAQATPGNDLALAGVVAPPRVILSEAQPVVTKSIVVFVENRGAESEIIPNATALKGLVTLQVKAIGGPIAPAATLLPPSRFPIELRPQQKLPVVFIVNFDGAGAAELPEVGVKHADFQYIATIHHEALDGRPDANPANDICPTAEDLASGSAAPAECCGPILARPRLPATCLLIYVAPVSTPLAHASAQDDEMGSTIRPIAPASGATTIGLSVEPNTHGGGAGCVIQTLTAKPMMVALQKGAALSDPITFKATNTGAGCNYSWGPGDAAQFSNLGKPSITCRWSSAGDHTVAVHVFNPHPPFGDSHMSIIIQVVQVTFQDESDADLPNPLRLGITTHGGIFEADRSRMLKAKVKPQSQANNVEVKAAAGSTSRLDVSGQQVSGDTITFKVDGVGKTGSSAPGDAMIEASLKSTSGGSGKWDQPVSVVRPAKLLPQTLGAQYQKNIQVNTLTNPSDPRIPANLTILATFYGWYVTVPVRDQFNESIDDAKLYLDAPVYENFQVGGELQALKKTNLKLGAGSSYLDPVGVPIARDYPNPHPSLLNLPPYNSLIATQHLANPTPAYFGPKAQPNTREVNTNTFQVEIATFPLEPLITRVLQLDDQGNLTMPTLIP